MNFVRLREEHTRVLSSVAEQWIADPRVTGSNPVVPFLVGVVGNISACHADARGSIPRLGVIFVFFIFSRKKVTGTTWYIRGV